MGDVSALDIAKFLEMPLHGEDFILKGVSALNDLKTNTLAFSKSKELEINSPCLLLVPLTVKAKIDNFSYITVSNPRLAFAKVLVEFFVEKKLVKIDSSVSIGKNTSIAEGVSIGKYTVIGDNVSIEENTIINAHVIIGDNTIIGKNTYIKSGTVIGEEGFGFDFEEDGTPIRIPHLGNVIIADEVEIGAKNTIARATLGSTKIANYVKIDDQVHIGHNCTIGEKTIITACVEISGSVHIGQRCWIAPNVSIMQKLHIGDDVRIGLGAVVTKDIKTNKKIMGLEGLELRSLMKLKRRIDYGK